MSLTTTTVAFPAIDVHGQSITVPAGTEVRISPRANGIRVRGQGWETLMTFPRAARQLACYSGATDRLGRDI